MRVATLILGALLVCGAGCGTQASNRITLRPQTAGELDTPNSDLHSDIEIVASKSKALYEGDILSCKATLESHETVKQTFEYRWLWYDSDDFQNSVGGGSETWVQEWIEAEDTKQMVGKANAPGMVAGRFELRYKKN